MVLTAEQLQHVANGAPLRFTEPQVEAEFVVVRADVFEHARQILDMADLSLNETRSLMWRTMRDDWEDPAMNAYDALGAE